MSMTNLTICDQVVKAGYDNLPSIVGGAFLTYLGTRLIQPLQLDPVSSTKFTALSSLVLFLGHQLASITEQYDDAKELDRTKQLRYWTLLGTLASGVTYYAYNLGKNDLFSTFKVMALAAVAFGASFSLQYFFTKINDSLDSSSQKKVEAVYVADTDK